MKVVLKIFEVIIMKKILLPVEKFVEEPETIKEAVDIAKKFESKITLLHVNIDKEMISRLRSEGYTDKEMEEEEPENKEKIIKLYEDEGLEVEVKEVEGDPASEIIDEAEEGDYDLVVMRTHGMKALKRFMLGSVTNKVVHHIKKPILVVR